MKKKMILMSIAIILLVTSVIGGAVAAVSWMAKDPVKNEVATRELKISLARTSQDEPATDVFKDGRAAISVPAVMPMAQIDAPIWAQNNGDYTFYARFVVTKYWLDENQEKDIEKDPGMITVGWKDDAAKSDWILVEDDENSEVVYLYYKHPLDPNQKTSDIFNVIQIGNVGNEYSGLSASLAIDAQAVQAIAADAAIEAEWGLVPTFDGDTLVNIEE